MFISYFSSLPFFHFPSGEFDYFLLKLALKYCERGRGVKEDGRVAGDREAGKAVIPCSVGWRKQRQGMVWQGGVLQYGDVEKRDGTGRKQGYIP